jgi:hypothetical protein
MAFLDPRKRAGAPTPPVQQANPFGYQFGLSPFDTSRFFGGVFSNINSALAALIAWVWAGLVALWVYTQSLLQWLYAFVVRAFGSVLTFFKWIWNTVVKQALVKVITIVQNVRAWLSRLLAPVLKYIRLIRQWYDWFFNTYAKPLLILIQKLRQVLGVFRLLGFKWAARLDADLAVIQNKITSVFITLRQHLNVVASWVGLIVDPGGILRRNPLFAALTKSGAELKNVVDTATVHTQTQGEVDKSNRLNALALPSTAKADQGFYATGKLPPPLNDARQQGIDAMSALPQNANGQL